MKVQKINASEVSTVPKHQREEKDRKNFLSSINLYTHEIPGLLFFLQKLYK